jgi:hypothetical protein
MSQLCFCTDEHISRAVIAGLRRRSIQVTTTKDAGLIGASDEVQLSFASQQGCVLVTQDDDFLKLHAKGLPHAGIAYAPQGVTVGYLVRSLVLIFQVLSPQDMINHVEFL